MAILVRAVDRVRGAVKLLVGLTRRQEDERVPLSLQLMAFRLGREWRVWTRGQGTQCFKIRSREVRGAMVDILPEVVT